MDLPTLKIHLLAQPGATEETPFGPDALVYKVAGKMFALVAWNEEPLRLTLKCDPADALALRQMYESVGPGYYMSKRHWNTITLDGEVPDDELRAMMDDSYALVVKGLPKKVQRELAAAA